MKVFLSWSGPRSRKVAKALHDWLPDVLQVVEPWMSTKDIATGKDFTHVLWRELAASNFGVLCLTRENCQSPWILFEAGALGKLLEVSHICPYLIDMEPADLPPPLGSLQSALMDEDGTYDLVRTINGASQTVRLPESQLRRSFDHWWPELKPKLVSKGLSLPPPLPVKEFFIVNFKSSGYLQAPIAEPQDGAAVEVVGYADEDDRRWLLHRVERERFAIKSASTDRCIDVKGGENAREEGVKVQQWEYWGGNNQKWAVIPQKDGSYKLKCKHSGHYLSFDADYVSQMAEADSRAQKWWLVPVVHR